MVEWTGIVAAISGAAVGIAGVASGYFQGRETRRHERALAADARHFETRRDLYVDVALHFARLHQWAVAVEPIVDIGQNEPSLPSDDEAGLLLDARTAALASPEVNQAVRNCSDAFRRFFHMGVNTFRSIRGQLGIGDPQTASAMETMETLRGRFVEEVSRLETLLRKELWSLK